MSAFVKGLKLYRYSLREQPLPSPCVVEQLTVDNIKGILCCLMGDGEGQDCDRDGGGLASIFDFWGGNDG